MKAHKISAVMPADRRMRRDDQHDDHRNCGRGYWCVDRRRLTERPGRPSGHAVGLSRYRYGPTSGFTDDPPRSRAARGDVPSGSTERASAGHHGASTAAMSTPSGRGQHPGGLEHPPTRSRRHVSAVAAPPLLHAARLFLDFGFLRSSSLP
jgi:hypothetical protein